LNNLISHWSKLCNPRKFSKSESDCGYDLKIC